MALCKIFTQQHFVCTFSIRLGTSKQNSKYMYYQKVKDKIKYKIRQTFDNESFSVGEHKPMIWFLSLSKRILVKETFKSKFVSIQCST